MTVVAHPKAPVLVPLLGTTHIVIVPTVTAPLRPLTVVKTSVSADANDMNATSAVLASMKNRRKRRTIIPLLHIVHLGEAVGSVTMTEKKTISLTTVHIVLAMNLIATENPAPFANARVHHPLPPPAATRLSLQNQLPPLRPPANAATVNTARTRRKSTNKPGVTGNARGATMPRSQVLQRTPTNLRGTIHT